MVSGETGESRKRSVRRFVRNVLLGTVAGAALLPAAAILCADRLIFHPPETASAESGEFTVAAADGSTVALWYLPPETPGDYVILHSHGNAEEIGDAAHFLRRLHRAGFGVLAYDYPGYGRSGGRPSEKGVYRSADAAYRYLTQTLKIPPGRIVVTGFSVGSGAACYLAERHAPAALILLAPFTSAFQTVLPGVELPFDRFPNRRRMGKIAIPVWILHGMADRVVAPEHGKRLFELAPGPVRRLDLLPGVGHNDLPDRFAPEALRDFLGRNAP